MQCAHTHSHIKKKSEGDDFSLKASSPVKVTQLLKLYQLIEQCWAHTTNLFIRVCKCRCCLLFVMLNMRLKPTVNTEEANQQHSSGRQQVKTHKHNPALTNNQREGNETERKREGALHLLKLNIFSSAWGCSRPTNVLFIPTSQRNINQLWRYEDLKV